jgi:hypothetical protein
MTLQIDVARLKQIHVHLEDALDEMISLRDKLAQAELHSPRLNQADRPALHPPPPS